MVYAKRPFGGPEQVLKYLARYTHRVAISNRRLLSMEDGRVTFEWKDYAAGNQTKTMTLEAVEFIRRFLLHVLPSGFVHIRHFGFLANRKRKEKLALCRSLLAAPQAVSDASTDSPGSRDSASEERLRRCPLCNNRPAHQYTGPHCCGLRLLAGAPDRRHLMTTVSLPSTKSLTISLSLLRASGNPCLKLLFCLSGNVGAVCRPRNGHPPKWRVTIFTTESSRCQESLRTSVNQTVIQYP